LQVLLLPLKLLLVDLLLLVQLLHGRGLRAVLRRGWPERQQARS
jgi:hypothetical protein